MAKTVKAQPLSWKNVKVPIGKLKPWVHNPREITQSQSERLDSSFEEFGQVDLFAIGPDFEVYNGHQRLGVQLAKYGPKYVAECRQSNRPLTEQERRRLTLLLHAGATGNFNWDALKAWDAEELKLGGFDAGMLKTLKHDVNSLGNFLQSSTVEKEISDPGGKELMDRADELQAKWNVKLGDLYICGDHRIVCGDSTDLSVIARLMDGAPAHLSFTDPPWNVNYGANMNKDNKQGYKVRKIENDNLGEKFGEFCDAFMAALSSSMLPGAPIYLKMSAQEWPVIDVAIRKAGFHWSSTIIWNKDRLVLSRKDYHTKYEPLWYGWKEGAGRLAVVEDRKQSDVWDFERPSSSEEHPTMTPVPLIKRCIDNSSRPTNIVVDIFLGSGSTLIACEGTGRVCRGVEKQPKYVAVCLERWSMQTGKTPQLEGSNGKKKRQ